MNQFVKNKLFTNRIKLVDGPFFRWPFMLITVIMEVCTILAVTR